MRPLGKALASAVVLLVGGCSSTTPAAGPGTLAGDASVSPESGVAEGDDAGSVVVGGALPMCGMPPYVMLGIVVRAASADGMGSLVPGAMLTTSLCPGELRLSGDDGTIHGLVTKSAPFYARFQATNYAPTLISELQFDADDLQLVAPLPPAIFAALIPGFGPTKTAIVLGVMPDGGDGACNSLDGVSFAVDDHPEAKISYLSNDAIPMITTDSVTTVSGRALITEIAAMPAAGGLVTITGTKAGCTVRLAKSPYTGRAPLEAGFITLAPAFISDGAPLDGGADSAVDAAAGG